MPILIVRIFRYTNKYCKVLSKFKFSLVTVSAMPNNFLNQEPH